ncbi:chemotaxis protein CheW [Aeoliella sp.]|uniref:chemotaxis protein CheW n=1 Tax=Aeoliella sp. TaxID=2795800 RepID=UPI003CCBEFF0
MADSMTMSGAPDAGFTADGEQYLTFTVQGEEYGIDILRVQEIKGFTAVRPIPNAPPYVKGVLNLRGTVVPIVDLRSRFDMDIEEYTQFTVIIVVSIGDKVVGLIVDAVSDVLNIPAGEVVDAPEVGGDVDTTFCAGMAKVGEKLVLLLNIDKLVNNDAIQKLEGAA